MMWFRAKIEVAFPFEDEYTFQTFYIEVKATSFRLAREWVTHLVETRPYAILGIEELKERE